MNFKSKNIILFIVVFCLGIIFMITNTPKNLLEQFSLSNKCPDLLIQKGNTIYLHNSKLAKIPGRNPIKFNNLEEYIEYLKWQRSQNINCPVLFLQHEYDTQGNSKYKQINYDFKLQDTSLLLNASRNNPPYNKNLFPGFDPNNQYIGLYTPLDKMNNQSVNKISASPMDDDWGGVDYTKQLVDKGYYKDNEVKIWVG